MFAKCAPVLQKDANTFVSVKRQKVVTSRNQSSSQKARNQQYRDLNRMIGCVAIYSMLLLTV